MPGYGKADPAEAAAALSRVKRGGFWQPKKGLNHVRFMPPWAADQKRFWFETTVHWAVGPGRTVVHCNRDIGQPCFLCDEVARLQESGHPGQVKLAEDMGASTRILFNIVDMDHPEQGVQLFESGPQIFEQVVTYFGDPEWGDMSDPDKGYIITIDRTEQSPQYYQVRPGRETGAIKDRGWLENLQDLSKIRKVLTFEQQQAVYTGGTFQAEQTSQPTPTAQQTTAPAAGSAQNSAPQGAQAPAPSLVSGERTRRRCFSDFTEGDALCDRCPDLEDCKSETLKTPATEEPTKMAPPDGEVVEPVEMAPAPAPVVNKTPQPRCFGKLYDARTTDCQSCEHAESCKAEKTKG